MLIGITVVAVVFVVLWRQGAFLRISNYVQETREELKKCTWPSWEELKGSTGVVLVSIILLGGFTVAVDFVLAMIIRHLV
jgi:preprotein translocase subunit SecE